MAAVNAMHRITPDGERPGIWDGERCWFVKLMKSGYSKRGNYAKVFFRNNKPLILKSLNALEDRLDEKTFFVQTASIL